MPETERLFFALWPDAPVRQQLWALSRLDAERAGRPVTPENIHLTLAFIGSANSAMRACMEQAAARVQGAPFAMMFDQLGYWGRPRVRWAGCSSPPAMLLQLVRHLNTALAGCGYEPDPRPFVPHVTLRRKSRAPRAQMEFEPVYWPVRDFCLAVSLTRPQGVEYRVLCRWPLADGE